VLRCANCGTTVSEWARRCPECGDDLLDARRLPEPAASERVEEPLCLPEIRPPHRGIFLVAGTTLLAVFVMAAVVLDLERPAHRTAPVAKAVPTLPPTTAALPPPDLRPNKLFYADPEGSRVVPLDGTKPTVVLSSAGYPDAPLRVAGGVAFVHARRAYFLPDSSPAQLRALGAADRLIPALGGGELVGLVRGPSPIVVQFVNVVGDPNPVPPPVHLELGYQPIAQVHAGIVVVGSNREIQVWQTKTSSVGAPIGNSNFAILTHDDSVAWLSGTGCNIDGECPLHFTDTTSGADHVVNPPVGHGGFLAGGAFSPDGRLFAGFVPAPPGRGPQAQLAVVDLGPSIPVLIDDSVVAVGEPIGSAVWSSDGAVVFFGGINGPLHACESGHTRATTLDVPSSYSFTVY
jgi:hypothetical protein